MAAERPAEPVDPAVASLCASIRQKLLDQQLWFPEDDDVGLDAPALERIDSALEEAETPEDGKCIPFGTPTARDWGTPQYREMEPLGLMAFFFRFARIPFKQAQSFFARAPMAILPYLPDRSRIAAELFEKDPMLFDTMFAYAQLQLVRQGSVESRFIRDVYMATHLWIAVHLQGGTA